MRFGLILCILLAGCARPDRYGVEETLVLPALQQQTWAVAPALNLSGRRAVDPLLQADLVFEEVAQIEGVVAVPVNRVAEVYVALGIAGVQNPEDAAVVCEALGVDALVVPTVTLYDPYDPPKLGASLQLFFRRPIGGTAFNIDPHALGRTARAEQAALASTPPEFLQASAVFDAADGTTRGRLLRYARGRNDPDGPVTTRGFFLDMEAYCGFAYHALLEDLLATPAPGMLAAR